MDAYLEKLVKKGSAVAEEVEEAIEEEVVEEIEAAVTAEPEPEVQEEADTNDETVTETVDEEAVPDVQLETVIEKDEQETETETDGATSNGFIEPNTEIDAVNIRVYNSPDTRQLSRIISGHIVVLGQIEDFKIIEYMKHGFGLVKGYTRDI